MIIEGQSLSVLHINQCWLLMEKQAQLPLGTFEPCHEKTNVLVSDLVRHKPGCSATEDG